MGGALPDIVDLRTGASPFDSLALFRLNAAGVVTVAGVGGGTSLILPSQSVVMQNR